jgi:stress-induced morphogen
MPPNPMEIVFDNDSHAPGGLSKTTIEELVRAHLPDAQLKLYDLTGGGNHYQLEVVSEAFAGKTPLARQRVVNQALREPLARGDLHALALRCRTPGE